MLSSEAAQRPYKGMLKNFWPQSGHWGMLSFEASEEAFRMLSLRPQAALWGDALLKGRLHLHFTFDLLT